MTVCQVSYQANVLGIVEKAETAIPRCRTDLTLMRQPPERPPSHTEIKHRHAAGKAAAAVIPFLHLIYELRLASGKERLNMNASLQQVLFADNASPLFGLEVRLDDRKHCCSNIAVVDCPAGPLAELKCAACGARRGWLSKSTAAWVGAVIDKCGIPTTPIAVRRSSAAKAAAKQDEFLKQKYSSAGKSWYDIITETSFQDEPAPSGTEQDN